MNTNGMLFMLSMGVVRVSSEIAYSSVAIQSKWRACDGKYATNLAYITGTDTDYVASWAKNPSKSALLDSGKSSNTDLEAACDALLSEGQIGEIYAIKEENDPNCSGC